MIKWTEEQIIDIIQKYTSGTSKRQLGLQYNCSADAIDRLLKKHNIPIRSIKEANSLKLSDDVVSNIVDKYIHNTSVHQLTKQFRLSQDKIENVLKENGVKLRSYAVAKQLSRKYDLNDDYFKVQTPNMAYILGLIAADGNIAKNENGIFIELHQNDEYLLKNINIETNNTRPLKYYIHKHPNGTETPAVKFRAWSAEWKKDLAVYNLIPAKTFILAPPLFLKKEYRNSFIKGFFDGDGSIYFNKSHNQYIVIFSGASKKFIYWIKEVLTNDYGIISSKVETNVDTKGNNFYRFCISSKNALLKVYNIFYQNNCSTLELKRKKEKFEDCIKIIKSKPTRL